MEIYSKTQINEMAVALKSGKAIILPTDTVWGIISLNEGQIYTIKNRPLEKKVCKFIASVDELGLPSFLADAIRPYTPGSVSFVWKGISYRVPKCQYLIDLLRLTGPVYQSSANISGQDPVQSVQEVFSVFKPHYDYIVVVDNAPYEMLSQQPSTIIDLDKMEVVRQGEIDGQEILDEIKKGNS